MSETIENDEVIDQGYFKLNFSNGTTLVVSENLIEDMKEPLVMQFVLGYSQTY